MYGVSGILLVSNLVFDMAVDLVFVSKDNVNMLLIKT